MLRSRAARSVGFVKPCLPSPAERPPSGDGWIHEIKHDGFRIMARRDSTGVPAHHSPWRRLHVALPARGGGDDRRANAGDAQLVPHHCPAFFLH